VYCDCTEKKLPHAEVRAIDISNEALDVAKENASLNNTSIQFFQEDILIAAASQDTARAQPLLSPFDIIVSNPPYVTTSERSQMRINVLEYEPHTALFVPDDDPLKFYKAILDYGKKHLVEGGIGYFELNENLMTAMKALVKESGYQEVVSSKDLSGKDRMVKVIR
jgi:release factor glutamine methyltransferase